MKSKFDKRMIYYMPLEGKKAVNAKGLSRFIDYWAGVYYDKDESLYKDNIGQKLTQKSRRELFEWKNGGKISPLKTQSIENNYPLYSPVSKDLENRYLNHKEGGGAVWNIFYLHIISPNEYPIFDQHVNRAMYFMQPKHFTQSKVFTDLQVLNKERQFKAYEAYREFYKDIKDDTRDYLKKDGDPYGRKIDMALFSFGKFLMN